MSIDTLIVDDDELTLFLNNIFVKENSFHHDAELFSSGQKLLSFLDAKRDSLEETCIFLDLNMPGLGGWDVMELIQGKPYQEKLKIVILTSSVNKSDRDKAEEYQQIVSFIEKPLTDDKVKELKGNEALKQYF